MEIVVVAINTEEKYYDERLFAYTFCQKRGIEE